VSHVLDFNSNKKWGREGGDLRDCKKFVWSSMERFGFGSHLCSSFSCLSLFWIWEISVSCSQFSRGVFYCPDLCHVRSLLIFYGWISSPSVSSGLDLHSRSALVATASKIFPRALSPAVRAGRILDFLAASVLLCEPVRSLTASLLWCCRALVFIRSVTAPARALLFVLGSCWWLREDPVSPVFLRPDLN
jgi:hypothetical protein